MADFIQHEGKVLRLIARVETDSTKEQMRIDALRAQKQEQIDRITEHFDQQIAEAEVDLHVVRDLEKEVTPIER